jgi:hypothetical protein
MWHAQHEHTANWIYTYQKPRQLSGISSLKKYSNHEIFE